MNLDALKKEDLLQVMPYAKERIDKFIAPLIRYCKEYGIDTEERFCAFLAQVAHESGEFRYVRELASGQAYDTGRLAARLGNTPEADGDGQRYKGRGLIQITGRDNYKRCGKALGLDLIANPELLEKPDYAVASACWYWHSHRLNDLADFGEFETITRRINGGLNGYQDRCKYWDRAKKVFGHAAVPPR